MINEDLKKRIAERPEKNDCFYSASGMVTVLEVRDGFVFYTQKKEEEILFRKRTLNDWRDGIMNSNSVRMIP
jgi:phage pi2 protein 07